MPSNKTQPAYDATTQSIRQQNIDPLSSVPGVQKTITNQSSYPDDENFMDVRLYNKVKVTFAKTGGTDDIVFKVEASTQDNGVAQTLVQYLDISQYGVEPLTQPNTSDGYASDVMLEIDTRGISFLNFTVDRTAGTANDADYSIFANQTELGA